MHDRSSNSVRGRTQLGPRQWLRFVELDPFTPAWKRLKLTDDDLRALQIAIILSPEQAPVIQGTGGVRKLRFAPESWNTGKSGAARVYYTYFPNHGLVALIYAHGKNEVETIPASQKATLRTLITDIQRYLDQRRPERLT